MWLKKKYYKTYLKCLALIEEDLKNERKTLSHRAINDVKEILLKDEERLKNDIEQLDDTDPDRGLCRMYLNLVRTQIGILYIEAEQFTEGLDYLMKCLDSIETPLLPWTIHISVIARNKIGYVLLRQSKPEEALKFLKEAEKIYNDFISVLRHMLKNIVEDVEDPISAEETVEWAHTMTKYYLAQAYEVLEDFFKSSVYCHETLKRQLSQKNLDPIDWALNSAILSQFFMDRMLFKQGRHHTAAASHVLEEYENKLQNENDSEEEIARKKEELRYRSADLSWCWAKYGAIILKHSRYKLSNPEEDIVNENQRDLERLWFDNLDLTRFENQITDEDVVTFEDAREVFLFSQRHLKKAKEYYTLEDRASKHVQIVIDHSMLFSLLSAFEPDKNRQFKILKKRADMLEVVVKELNPQYYMDLCRQLWFELGEVYHDMMVLEFERGDVESNPRNSGKVNSLNESSVKNFNLYLDSNKDKKTGELPDPLEEVLISPILSAYFYLGRLHFKYVTADKVCQVEHTKKSYEFFKCLVEYCDKYENAKAIVGEKYQLSKDLVMLLRIQLLRLM